MSLIYRWVMSLIYVCYSNSAKAVAVVNALLTGACTMVVATVQVREGWVCVCVSVCVQVWIDSQLCLSIVCVWKER